MSLPTSVRELVDALLEGAPPGAERPLSVAFDADGTLWRGDIGEDLLRFLAACLTPPPGALGAALALAQQPHARTRLGTQFGLCWIVSTPWKAVDRRQRPRIVWHNGGTWGFAAFAGFAPDRGTAAVTLSNTLRAVDASGLRLLEARGAGQE